MRRVVIEKPKSVPQCFYELACFVHHSPPTLSCLPSIVSLSTYRYPALGKPIALEEILEGKEKAPVLPG